MKTRVAGILLAVVLVAAMLFAGWWFFRAEEPKPRISQPVDEPGNPFRIREQQPPTPEFPPLEPGNPFEPGTSIELKRGNAGPAQGGAQRLPEQGYVNDAWGFRMDYPSVFGIRIVSDRITAFGPAALPRTEANDKVVLRVLDIPGEPVTLNPEKGRLFQDAIPELGVLVQASATGLETQEFIEGSGVPCFSTRWQLPEGAVGDPVVFCYNDPTHVVAISLTDRTFQKEFDEMAGTMRRK